MRYLLLFTVHLEEKLHMTFLLCFAYGNSLIKTIKQNGSSRVRVLQDRYTKKNNMLSDNPHLS